MCKKGGVISGIEWMNKFPLVFPLVVLFHVEWLFFGLFLNPELGSPP